MNTNTVFEPVLIQQWYLPDPIYILIQKKLYSMCIILLYHGGALHVYQSFHSLQKTENKRD